MNKEPLRPIADADIERVWQDGAICLPGMFDADWVTKLQAATDTAMANPGKLATGRNTADHKTFYVELGLWSAHTAFHDFIFDSPAPVIARRLLRTSKLNLFLISFSSRHQARRTKLPGTRISPIGSSTAVRSSRSGSRWIR
jgi:hypothetical protein